MFKSINGLLEKWTKAGLLSASQADAILAYESKSKQQNSWAIFGLVAIGIGAIGVGVVSVVAANWTVIPSQLKLVIYLAIQTSLAFLCLRFDNQRSLLHEALLALNALFVLAGIGLVAQTFNLVSNGWSGLLLWCAVTFPTVLLSRRRPLPYLWVAILLLTESIWFFGDVIDIDDMRLVTNFAIGAILAIYVGCAVGFLARGRAFLNANLSEALRIETLLLLFFGGTFLGNVIWYTGAGTLLNEIGDTHRTLLRLQFVPWLGALVMLPVFLYNQRPGERRLSLSMTILFFTLAAFVTIPLLFELGASRIAATALTLLLWWNAAVAAIYADRKRLFDFLTFAIVMRLLGVYFEVFGSMLATGIGLIISGAVILFVAHSWYRYRHKVAAWLGGTSHAP